MTLIQKLSKIMSEVGYIQKDKTNAFHKYNYASEQAIKQAVHPMLVKHGVLFTLSAVDLLPSAKQDITNIRFAYAFINVDDAQDRFEGSFIGSGQDTGDKGTYKAITGAIKYILTSTFLIPTGDDPEEDGAVQMDTPVSPKKVPVVDIAPQTSAEVPVRVEYACAECLAPITKAEHEYSIKLFKYPLCRKHQTEAKAKSK